ncbi:MAG: response regulator, partial [Desulfobulbaceae bacterium]|nr:response regulator [Desulfobulbaceae bacterium]
LRVIRTAIRHVSVAMVPPAPLPPAAGEENKKRPRVLVAEDDFINRTLMVTILEQEQWRTTAVENGRLALEALAAGEYDLVLMDLQMPEMDGLTATARIREQEKGSGKHIPIVALTAHAMKEDRDRCLAAGMDDYISKPVEYDRLFEVLNKLTTSE